MDPTNRFLRADRLDLVTDERDVRRWIEDLMRSNPRPSPAGDVRDEVFRDRGPEGSWTSFNCQTRSAMIARVQEHLAAGHDVQTYVIRDLRAEIAESGDAVEAPQ